MRGTSFSTIASTSPTMRAETIETVYFGDVVRVKQTACDQDQRHIGGKLPD